MKGEEHRDFTGGRGRREKGTEQRQDRQRKKVKGNG
jgi:hypothetical protein